MRAREVFMRSLVEHGVRAIFGNPGTTENPLLISLADFPQLQYYVALHEGVAVCAAGAFSLASGTTAVANVHVAPGLGNAIGMMYGALKARAPLVVTAGQQDTRLRLREPLLSHDLVAMAAPVCKWAAEPRSPDELGPIMAEAFRIANTYPKGPVFVSLPNNVMEGETEAVAAARAVPLPPAAQREALQPLATALAAAAAPVIVVGDDVAAQCANPALQQLAETIGAAVRTDFLQARLCIGTQHPNRVGGMPVNSAALRAVLEPHDVILMVGGPTLDEVWYDPDDPIPTGSVLLQLESDASMLFRQQPARYVALGELNGALAQLCDLTAAAMGDADAASARNGEFADALERRRQGLEDYVAANAHRQPIPPGVALHALAGALPDDIVVVDESITAGPFVQQAFDLRGPADWFAGRGGGIGQGIAGAIGVAAAQDGRRVVAISGDGSAMYSIQALWSAAHHGLNILFVILANREYRVLKHNVDVHRQRFNDPSDAPYPHMDLTNPNLRFTDMAQGMGVAAARCEDVGGLRAAVERALQQDGPFLLEIVVEGKE